MREDWRLSVHHLDAETTQSHASRVNDSMMARAHATVMPRAHATVKGSCQITTTAPDQVNAKAIRDDPGQHDPFKKAIRPCAMLPLKQPISMGSLGSLGFLGLPWAPWASLGFHGLPGVPQDKKARLDARPRLPESFGSGPRLPEAFGSGPTNMVCQERCEIPT